MLHTALILLVVVSVIGIAAMKTSGMQTRATTNQNNKRTALLAAEAGASVALEAFKNGSGLWWSALPTTATAVSLSGSGVGNGQWRLESTSGLSVDRLARQTLPIIGVATDPAGTELARVKLEVAVAATAGVPPSGFAQGMLTDRDITVSGQAGMQGNAHTNGSFLVTGRGAQNQNSGGMVSSVGTIDYAGPRVNTAGLNDSAANVDVLSQVGTVDAHYQSVFTNQTFSTCSIPTGDLGGAAYYCDGSISLSGAYTNGIIYVRGSVDSRATLTKMRVVTLQDFVHSGGGALGTGPGNTVAIAAAGNIVLQGGGSPMDVHGTFWTNGSLDRRGNGQSSVVGAFVAFGNISFKGNLNYIQNNDYAQQGFGAPTTEVRILGWREVE
jgi:hypothetical protein